MNVTMFSPELLPPPHYGGTSRVIVWLVRELAALGHRVALIGPQGCKVPGAARVLPYEMPKEDINLAPVDFREMIPGDTDIVHLHSGSHLEYGFPVLKTVHGYPYGRVGEYYAARSQFDEQYSFVSNAHRYVCGRPECPFVHNGIDPADYRYEEAKDDYLLFLGMVDWGVKGINLALEVARRKHLKLKIAGTFFDPAYYENTLKRELSADIEYVGPVGGEEKRELLARARALLFPTLWPEPFGLVVTEALASGTPVITTHNGAMPEIMVHGVTGFMADTVSEMADFTDRLGEIDPKVCRAHVERYFSSRVMAESYLRVYHRVIENHLSGTRAEGRGLGRFRELQRIVDRDPGDVESWLRLAALHLEEKRLDAARTTLRGLVKANPLYFPGYVTLAKISRLNGDNEEAARIRLLMEQYRSELVESLLHIDK